MIRFERLTYTYPGASEAALAGVTLEIGEGEFVLIAGPSGVGKSTLLRCLNGLVPHFSGGRLAGRVRVAGYDPVAAGPQTLSHIVGFVFQDPEGQFVLDQVEDEIAFALENAGVDPAEMRLRVEEVLQLLDLTGLRGRSLETLSGGEKQRVAIAAALVLQPQVLALDEPTSQLDPQSAEEVLQALVRLNERLGLTVVLVEQRLERVLPYADRLIYLGSGGEVVSGAPREVLREMELAPPLVVLGKALGWEPPALTVKEGRARARALIPRQAEGVVASGREERRPSGLPGRSPSLLGVGSNPDREEGAALRVERVSYAYNGQEALRGVNLDVGAGELVALMGRNGSGKTTLLRCIVGLLTPRAGKIAVGGVSVQGRETAEICREVGYLPQAPDDLLFAETVGDELAVTLRNHGMLGAPPLDVGALLARLGLGEVRGRYPRDLSVGQRQRVALGAVTVTRPRLLLLDEPTRGLDYGAKAALVGLLREWQAEGTAILLVTHDVELVAEAAQRVVLLSEGEVIADAAPGLLAGSPLFAPQVAQLFPGRGWLTVAEAVAGLGSEEMWVG